MIRQPLRHKLVFGVLVFVAGLSGACATGSIEKSASHAPRSAQYTMGLDWDYALQPRTPNYLGATPLELGNILEVGGVTYVASTLGRVLAISDTTARTLWDVKLSAPVSAGPVVDGSGVYVALSSGSIKRLNIRDGSEVWTYETHVPIEQSLVVSDGVVASVNSNNRLYVLDAATGALKWRRERPRSQEFTMYGQAPPLIDDGKVYAGYSDGFLLAYALLNGTVLWSRELAPHARFKDLDCQPVRMDDTLYLASSSGGVYALNVADGKTLWQRDILGVSSVVAFQDSLYLSSQSGVFRLDRASGATIWQNLIQKDVLISALSLGRKSIYVGVQRLGLVVIDRVSGMTEHVIDMGSDFSSAPRLSPGKLTAFSNRSTVYRFLVDDHPIGL